MVQDYSRRYSSTGPRQKVRRRNTVRRTSQKGLLWKMIGVLVSFAAVGGVAASLWLGWQIDSVLGDLGGARHLRQQEMLQSKMLAVERNSLMKREGIEASAARLGLYPPDPKQELRP